MRFWIKNTKGEQSASLTMSIISFSIVTLWLIGWLVTTPLGIDFPSFDATGAMAYLSPILALYFGRRWTAQRSEMDDGYGYDERGRHPRRDRYQRDDYYRDRDRNREYYNSRPQRYVDENVELLDYKNDDNSEDDIDDIK